MKKLLLIYMGLLLVGGGQGYEVRGSFEGKELWRKELGRERCLLLYIEENGELRMAFTDGPWVYLTEELTERVKHAGMQLWEQENGISK